MHHVNHMKKYIDNRKDTWCNNTNTKSMDYYVILKQIYRLFEMIVGVLTTCHTQYTWDRSIFFFYVTEQHSKFLLHITGALYVHPLWFYKHQHDNRVRSKLFVACQRWWFQWRFWFVPSLPGYLREEEEHKPDTWRNLIERKNMGLRLENEVASC